MIHPTAVVHPTARIGDGVEVGPYCVIGEDVTLGARTRLLAHAVVNGSTTIGEDCVIYPFTSIGMKAQDRKYEGEHSFTKIGNRTTIREYVSIHRATGEGQTTTVGDDCFLLSYVHVAHNCTIGNHVTMSSTSQLAGHVTIEDHVVLGGMTGMHQFVRIGRYAMIGGFSKTARDVPPFHQTDGTPSVIKGLNLVGLRRAGFSRETIAELRRCHDLLYRERMRIADALEAMRGFVQTEEGRQLITFVENSTRGIMRETDAGSQTEISEELELAPLGG